MSRLGRLEDIDYQSMPLVTLYTGGIGHGTTAAAVIHLVELIKADSEFNLVTNMKLIGVEYESFDIEKVDNYIDAFKNRKTLFVLDCAYLYMDSRNYNSKENMLLSYLIACAEKFGHKFVFTLPERFMADARIRYLFSFKDSSKLKEYACCIGDDDNGNATQLLLTDVNNCLINHRFRKGLEYSIASDEVYLIDTLSKYFDYYSQYEI